MACACRTSLLRGVLRLGISSPLAPTSGALARFPHRHAYSTSPADGTLNGGGGGEAHAAAPRAENTPSRSEEGRSISPAGSSFPSQNRDRPAYDNGDRGSSYNNSNNDRGRSSYNGGDRGSYNSRGRGGFSNRGRGSFGGNRGRGGFSNGGRGGYGSNDRGAWRQDRSARHSADGADEAEARPRRRRTIAGSGRGGGASGGSEEGGDEEVVDEAESRAKAAQWQTQKAALREKFPLGWSPPKKLSPDALSGLRALHAQFPETYSTPVLSNLFGVSPEAVRRILKSRWSPVDGEGEEERRERWVRRGVRVWEGLSAKGIKVPRRWREEGVGGRGVRAGARAEMEEAARGAGEEGGEKEDARVKTRRRITGRIM